MSRTLRSACLVMVYFVALLVLPGAYTVSDQSSALPEVSPSPTPTPQPSPSMTSPPSPDPSPTATESAAPEPTPEPDPEPSPSETEGEKAPSAAGAPEELTLDLSLHPSSVPPGESTTISTVVSNPSEEAVEGVDVTVVFPNGLDFESSSPQGEVTVRPSGTAITFTSMDVPAEGSISLSVVASPTPDAKKSLIIESSVVWSDGETSARVALQVETPETNLELTTSGGGFFKEVGGQISYKIIVKNTGDDPATEISLVNLVPSEVHVLSAEIAPGVDAVQVGSNQGKEDVVWVIDELAPKKSIQVTYTGTVENPGDLEAVNKTRALSLNAGKDQSEERTYLANTGDSASDNPSFDPQREKRVTREKVVERPLVRMRVATEPDAETDSKLPFTGVDPLGTLAFGLILLALGGMLLHASSGNADRRRIAVASFVVLMVAGACISNDGSDVETRVKGLQIERGNDQPDSEPNTDSNDPPGTDDPGDDSPGPTDDPGDDPGEGNSGSGGDDNGGDPGDAGTGDSGDSGTDDTGTTVALVPGEPVTTFERNVDFVTITEDDLPVSRIGSAQGSAMTFGWNDSTGAITSATSSNTTLEGVADLAARISTDGPGMRLEVSLTNIAQETRVDLRGRLAVEVTTGRGTHVLRTPVPRL